MGPKEGNWHKHITRGKYFTVDTLWSLFNFVSGEFVKHTHTHTNLEIKKLLVFHLY